MVENRRIHGGVDRGEPFEIEVDGDRILAYTGETIAAAIMASGKRIFRRTSKHNRTRGIHCGIGICFDCLMVVNDRPNTRTCQTPATPGCQVRTQIGFERDGETN